ncbi:MAG: ABC transporter substrate-binding protein [Fusobacteriaceae bacterium]
MLKKIGIASIVLSGLLLTGCGQKDKASAKKEPSKATLNYAQISEGKTLDPQDSTEQYSQRVTTMIYDRLMEIDETNGTTKPGLAERVERLDDNTIILHLNKKAKFHNGDFLKASDVKFTLERAKSLPKVGHLYALIENVEIIDDNTVKVSTSEPFAPLLNHLSHKTSGIISEKYFKEKGNDYFQNPIGTGPYKFKEWRVGDRISLESNPEYFKGTPEIKEVIIRAIPEENSKVIGLETGELDMVSDIDTIGRNTIIGSANLEFLETPSTTTTYVGFNNKKDILADKEVRQALAMGIDRDAILEALLSENTKKANGFLAPPIFGYSEDSKLPEYNPKKAKEILEKKGLLGQKLTFGTSNSQLRTQMAEIIQAQLKEIGIDMNIQILEWGAFLTATGNGDLDMFIMGWGPSTYDADYGLYPNFHSKQMGDAGNRTYYSNPQVDILLDGAKKEMDADKRKNMYGDIVDILNTDMPVLPMYYSNNTMGITKKLKNVQAVSYPLFNQYKFEN